VFVQTSALERSGLTSLTEGQTVVVDVVASEGAGSDKGSSRLAHSMVQSARRQL
jgi:cold shock CspA family protein